jgi:hypothetical protein
MSTDRAQSFVGTIQLVLVEGESRRSSMDLKGRADGNRVVVFEKVALPSSMDANTPSVLREPEPGDYVAVEIVSGTYGSLRGRPIARTTLQQFHQRLGSFPTSSDFNAVRVEFGIDQHNTSLSGQNSPMMQQ